MWLTNLITIVSLFTLPSLPSLCLPECSVLRVLKFEVERRIWGHTWELAWSAGVFFGREIISTLPNLPLSYNQRWRLQQLRTRTRFRPPKIRLHWRLPGNRTRNLQHRGPSTNQMCKSLEWFSYDFEMRTRKTKQKQQTNGNRAFWLVYQTDKNACGFWLVKRTLW